MAARWHSINELWSVDVLSLKKRKEFAELAKVLFFLKKNLDSLAHFVLDTQ